MYRPIPTPLQPEPPVNEKTAIVDDDYAFLDQDEITQLFDSLDTDHDGFVTADDIDSQIRTLCEKLPPAVLLPSDPAYRPTRHYMSSHDESVLTMKSSTQLVAETGLMNFTERLLPGDTRQFSYMDFATIVEQWHIPTQKKIPHHTLDAQQRQRIPRWRRIRAYLDVHGPNISFFAFVLSLQIGCAVWQFLKFFNQQNTRHAFGAGLIISKTCAGALYPTLFFLVMSMSRRAATWLRRSRFLSRAINWDKSRTFHIYMAIEALMLGTIHGISHMTGTFNWATKPEQQAAVADLLHSSEPISYAWFAESLPSWTGILALFQFWVIALLGMPMVRKKWYELFQMAHLLMFPLIALLLAHGTAALIQKPLLQFWLVPPACLVLGERIYRHAVLPFYPSKARPTVLPGDITRLTIMQPKGKSWKHAAGQYVLIRIPAISKFEWHPFTVSACEENKLSVHIKADGGWTTSLRKLAREKESILVNVDGPFGAPAQRFYDYNYAVVIGGGIGITPFSAILNDMENSYAKEIDPWEAKRQRFSSRSLQSLASSYTGRISRLSASELVRGSVSRSPSPPAHSGKGSRNSTPERHPVRQSLLHPNVSLPASFHHGKTSSASSFMSSADTLVPHSFPKRRVDLHWTVRERNNITWFSDLLNRVIARGASLALHGDLKIDINTHITAPKRDICTHTFTHVLDSYRGADDAPLSLLTGVKQPSSFGRPDFKTILRNHFDDLVDSGVKDMKVGVFYCGAPTVGEILSDACHTLTATASTMGLKIRYDFLMEVFG